MILDQDTARDCTHMAQLFDHQGHRGWFCEACGVTVHRVETRECQGCKHFVSFGMMSGSICRSKLMAVTPDMHVTYRVVDGSCWEDRLLIPEGAR